MCPFDELNKMSQINSNWKELTTITILYLSAIVAKKNHNNCQPKTYKFSGSLRESEYGLEIRNHWSKFICNFDCPANAKVAMLFYISTAGGHQSSVLDPLHDTLTLQNSVRGRNIHSRPEQQQLINNSSPLMLCLHKYNNCCSCTWYIL